VPKAGPAYYEVLLIWEQGGNFSPAFRLADPESCEPTPTDLNTASSPWLRRDCCRNHAVKYSVLDRNEKIKNPRREKKSKTLGKM